ncbi:hypothetical protein Tco_1122123 [Tanacetum coccineum]|uniref:Uncharacterized protein n=1 Tax=Tanacetum coccineum TaxID=301880 RepID=A0ABQ5IZN0_9ASTR
MEKELTEQQKQRKAQVQFEAQHYTEEYGMPLELSLKLCRIDTRMLGKEFARRRLWQKDGRISKSEKRSSLQNTTNIFINVKYPSSS